MLSTKRRYTKPKHARLPHREWLAHIEHCRKNNVSPAMYCAKLGLSLKVFKHHDWLERRKQASSNFALVKVVNEPTAVVSPYEIVFPRGVSLRVPTSSSLCAILKSLEAYL